MMNIQCTWYISIALLNEHLKLKLTNLVKTRNQENSFDKQANTSIFEIVFLEESFRNVITLSVLKRTYPKIPDFRL